MNENQMSDDQLINFIDAEEANIDDTELSSDREQSVDYYYGRAEGKLSPPSIPDRSSYVSRDVADTIDWIKPALMKTFMAGDTVCEFTPKGPEDVAGAKQESDYINHVILEQNPAYELLETWFDDGLIQKNGYVVAYWKTEKYVEEEQFSGLGDEELAILMQDPEVEIAQAETYQVGVAEDGSPINQYTVTLKRVNETGKVCIENIPPEYAKVSWRHKGVGLRNCPFVGYDAFRTISEVREDGFDIDDDIPDEQYGNNNGDTENYNRQNYYNSVNRYNEANDDPASRLVRVRYRWMRVDYDGDGIAELRYLMIIGREILVNEKADIIQMAALTPRVVAHNHIGRSVAEIVEDLQELKTMFIRGLVDNVVLANNGRTAIDQNVVKLDDMLVSRPGGVVRVNGSPSAALMPLNNSMLGAPVMQAVEMLDSIRETRTGVTKYNMGTDAGSLNKTATGIGIIHSAANQRIEWIARTFAETGVKDLFHIAHALTLKNMNKPAVVRLRNEWVTVDPREWKKRNDMTVSVGLGATNREMQMQSLTVLGNVQKMAFQAGVVSPENIYNLCSEMAKANGYKDPDKFFTHPKNMPKKEPAPDPKMEKIKADMVNSEKDRELEREQMQFDNQKDTLELVANIAGKVNPYGGMYGT